MRSKLLREREGGGYGTGGLTGMVYERNGKILKIMNCDRGNRTKNNR